MPLKLVTFRSFVGVVNSIQNCIHTKSTMEQKQSLDYLLLNSSIVSFKIKTQKMLQTNNILENKCRVNKKCKCSCYVSTIHLFLSMSVRQTDAGVVLFEE